MLRDGATETGGIDRGVAGALQALGEDRLLIGERHVFEDEDLAGPEDAVDALQRPGDG